MTPAAITAPRKKRVRPDAKPGKFFVPPAEEWNPLRVKTRAFVRQRALVAPLGFAELETEAAALLAEHGLGEPYREFLIVLINNEIWRDVVATIPYHRRTLLLPPCLRSTRDCKAGFDEYGLLCEQCGACCIGGLSETAEKLGYAVLVAEGTSIVSSLLAQGAVDAVIGVSCMPSLERSFPHMADKAVPGLAIPLLQDGCENTKVVQDWVHELMHLSSNNGDHYVDLNELKETVQGWFTTDGLTETLGTGTTDTETVSIDWLAKSGKRWRPFLIAAVYQALQPSTTHHSPSTPGAERPPLPSPVRQVAIAVECIHKASLVCDDIQDGDAQRYGEQTVHETHGIPVALTAALFLLGQGYRLIAACGAPPETVNAMLQLTTQGHCDLCLGQGAELCWMRAPAPLTADEVLYIFRYKTAPSFDVVFRLGALLANATDEEHAILHTFSTAVGIAYQVQDDLQDFQRGGDVDDVKMQRPSIVVALAHDRATGDQRTALADAWCKGSGADSETARRIITELEAETAARDILETHKAQALAALRPLKNRNLKILLHRLVGKIFT